MQTTTTARKYEAGTNQAPNDPAIWVQPRSAIGICTQGSICFKNLGPALALDRKASDRPYPGRRDFSVVGRAT
ncbi:hypothetical protein Tco_0199737 [Tanacetum coccineum]